MEKKKEEGWRGKRKRERNGLVREKEKREKKIKKKNFFF